jgi:signal transduction histidine kinase
MAVTVTVAALLLVVLLHRSLLREVDNRAKQRLEDVSGATRRGQLAPTLAGGDEDGTVAQVLLDGRVVAQSPVVQGTAPLANFVPEAADVTIRTVRRTPVREGASFRIAAQRVDTPEGSAVVYAAAALEPMNDSMRALEALLAVVLPALVLLVGVTTYLLVGRTLRPVEAMRRRVAEISARDLDQRVPEPGTGDEVDRLAHTMNTMLERLEDASVRQRSFVSDAAHELRSPLAAMRAELEIVGVENPSRVQATVERMQGTLKRMERLVEDLLVLATAEEQGIKLDSDVDLDEIVLRQTEALRATSALTVNLRGVNAARVRGHRDSLERAIANLIDNAERHAATTVTIELVRDNGVAELVVADDGRGIAAADRSRVFDRFARVDDARDRTHGGAGLGLAIARRIVEEHGGSIEIKAAGKGARFVVRFPA